MERYKDFDAAVAAMEPIRFKLAGREHVLEQEPPAIAVFALLNTDRNMLEGDADTETVNATIQALKSMIGNDRFDQMLADGASLTQIFELSMWLMEQCGASLQDEDGSNGNGPNRQARRSTSKKSSKVGQR